MHLYECPYANAEVETPELDAWEGMLGNTSRGIPDSKTFIIDANTGKQTTYGEARSLALKIAHGLRTTAGLKSGEALCIFSPNSALYPILCMAAQAAGIIASLANPTYTKKEFLHQLRDSRVVLILATSDMLDGAKEAAKEAGIPESRIYALPGLDGAVKAGALSYEKLVSSQEWKHESIRGDRLNEVAYLPYSSGTTGLPKGVDVSHRNVVAVSEMMLQVPNLWTKDTVMLATLPMFHIFSLTVSMHHVMRVGGTMVVMPKFDLLKFLDCIGKYRCTATCVVPPMALGLAKHPAVDKADFSSLKEVICGAAPLSSALTAEVTKRIKAPLHQGYGMTETTSVATLNRQGRNKVGSVGCLIPGQQARIVKADGKDAEKGGEGEIWLRGPNIVQAYHGNTKATNETFTKDGWLQTGDVGYFDNEGYLTIVDRTKELIKYKGFQVAPAELEAILLGCDMVADAAVIGVYSEKDATELPRAYVTLSPKGKGTKDVQKAIQLYVQNHCAPHKRLRGGVHLIDVVPKSLSGKILRKDLRTLAAQEEKTKAKL